MAIYLVDISLRNLGRDYAPLWQAMSDAHAQSVMDTTWLMDLAQDINSTTKALLSHLAAGDRLFVIEFKADTVWTATGMDEEAKAWLRQRLPGVATGLTPPPNPAS
jgi:hypothetical protein